jgi:hypothetical protein
MSSKSRIDRKKFLEIKRLVDGTEAIGRYNAEAIARETGVGVTTVRQIRRAKTWPGYQRLNARYHEARKSKASGRPEAGVGTAPSKPKQQDMFAKRVELSQEDYDTLMALVPTVKQLKEWHDSYQKLAEDVAERMLTEQRVEPIMVKRGEIAGDDLDIVSARLAQLDSRPVEQPKKKRFGIFGGRK